MPKLITQPRQTKGTATAKPVCIPMLLSRPKGIYGLETRYVVLQSVSHGVMMAVVTSPGSGLVLKSQTITIQLFPRFQA